MLLLLSLPWCRESSVRARPRSIGGCEDDPLVTSCHGRLKPRLSAESVGMACVRGDRSEAVSGRMLTSYLHEMQDRGLYQAWGCSSAADFARKRLSNVKPSQARDLIAVDRALRELDQVGQAFPSGEIRWSKARLLARIATPESEEA